MKLNVRIKKDPTLNVALRYPKILCSSSVGWFVWDVTLSTLEPKPNLDPAAL